MSNGYYGEYEEYPIENCHCHQLQKCQIHGQCLCTILPCGHTQILCGQCMELLDYAISKREEMNRKFLELVDEVVTQMPMAVPNTATL